MKYDLFICHASEDKDEFVNPLFGKLESHRLNVWYDDKKLELGDSLRRSIDEGLSQSKYGIVVLSPSFFKKDWPQKELDGLVAKERNGIKVILPIWHRIDFNDVIKYSPTLADRIAAKSSEGIDNVVNKIIRAIQKKNESEELDSSMYYRDVANEEAEVLISALSSGGIIKIIETDQTGRIIQIGNRDYYDNYRPEIRVSYLEALKKLIEKDLVFKETEIWFNLTKTGYEYARTLEINSLMEKAWEYYEDKKEYSKSIELYREIVKKYTETGIAKEAQKMIGVNILKLKDPTNAEIELKRAIDMGNDLSSAHFYYGEALLNNMKYKEAAIAFEASLTKADVPEWIKATVPGKIVLCQKGVKATLAVLSDKNYAIEKEKIDKEIPHQEADYKEKAILLGQRWSSGLARNISKLYLDAAKWKIEIRLRLDKENLLFGARIRTEDDIYLLMKRLTAVVDTEKIALKENIIRIYKDCHADSYLVADMPLIDQEIKVLLEEIHTKLTIEKEGV